MGSPRDSVSMSQALKMREEGFKDGVDKGRLEIIDWLEAAYLGPSAPPRNSPEGQAILKLAQDAAAHFRPRVGNGGKKRP